MNACLCYVAPTFPVCLPVCLHVCLSPCLHVCLSVRPSQTSVVLYIVSLVTLASWLRACLASWLTAWLYDLPCNRFISPRFITAVPWRERRDYPKDHDHFEVYVTDEALPMTGERALTDGCGRNGRPYKYRGKGHITELGRALQGVTDEVWVGAVVTTTPWVWSSEY